MRLKAFKLATTIALLSLPFIITGCHKDFGPFAMPTGFKHHQDKYKAPDGPEPVIVKTLHESGVRDVIPHQDDMAVTNAGNIEYVTMPVEFEKQNWGVAVTDVVDRLARSYDFNGKSVYVMMPDSADPNEVAVYEYLALELPLQNLNIGAADTSPLTLFYDYHMSPAENDLNNVNQMTLTVTLQENTKIVAEHSSHFIYDGSLLKIDDTGASSAIDQSEIEPLVSYESADSPMEITPYE